MKLSVSTYKKITFLALVALVAIIITGGIVRLSGSGLGCSDWPTCEEGQLAAEIKNPHALVEFLNRVITGVVSVAVILAVLGALFLTQRRKNLIWWSLGLVLGVLAQVVLGAFVVLYHLHPALVMSHFLVSMLLVTNAVILHYKTGQIDKPPRTTQKMPHLFWLTRLATVVTASAIIVGTILTGAGPHSGGERGEEGDEVILRYGLDISNLARIHASLVILLLCLIVLGWFLLYRLKVDKRIWRRGSILFGIAISQSFIGYVQYFSGVPEILVGFHIAGATLLWAAMVYFHLETCTRRNINFIEKPLNSS